MQYPIVTSYVKDWDIYLAARELISNCLDGKNPEIKFEDGILVLINRDTKLDRKCLLLGHSEKSDGAIGQFGEGLKLGSLVLAREEVEYTFQNADEMWQWSLGHSKTLDAEVLQMRRKPCKGTDVIVRIGGLDEAKMRGRCLALQPAKIIHEWDGIQVLDLEERGHVYVGGIWVYQSDCKHSYNFQAGQVKMNRDRGMLDDFDLKYTLRNVWASPSVTDEREVMLAADDPDVAGYEYRPIVMSASFGSSGRVGYIRGRAMASCIGLSTPKPDPINKRLKTFLLYHRKDMPKNVVKTFESLFAGELG